MADGSDGLWQTGERFAAGTTAVTAAAQARCLAACEADPAGFGGTADPSLFGNLCYLAILGTGRGIDGWVHTGQRIRLTAPIDLGEPLLCDLDVASLVPAKRGRAMHLAFRFARNGHAEPVVLSDLFVLLPDPGRMGTTGTPGEPRPPDSLAGFDRVGIKTLTPERVTGYAAEVGNRIHFEPAFAETLGYRAPLAQGLMGITWVTAALAARHGPSQRLDLACRFLRPIHWDETIALHADARRRRWLAVNAAGRIATEARIDELA